VIARLVVLGGTGDLMGRYLLPGLAALQAKGHLPPGFELVGAARDDWDDDQFRTWAAGWLGREGIDASALLSASRYRRIELGDPASVRACVAGDGPLAAYLALPPAVFPVAVSALHDAGLPPESQVVLEKPFGEDLDSARALNRLLAESRFDGRHVYRVDHFLAMTAVQNVLGTRLANRVLEAIWTGDHIDEIEILWEETLALEGRAGYYDGVGALKDVLQNHLLQVLCLAAMEPPASLGERDLRDRKVDVLRSVRPLQHDDVATRTRRARYRGYVDEDGVVPENGTETFAEVVLEVDSPRWPGTRFRLRTGKALGRERKEVVVHFRPVAHDPFEQPGGPAPNRLRFGLEPEGLSIELRGGRSRRDPEPRAARVQSRGAAARATGLRPHPARRPARRRDAFDPSRRSGGVMANRHPGARELGPQRPTPGGVRPRLGRSAVSTIGP
jgi:glucose-6-phosphate 1-dehydrogenase